MLLIALIVIIAFAHGLLILFKKNFNIKIIIKLILSLIYNNFNLLIALNLLEKKKDKQIKSIISRLQAFHSQNQSQI